MNDIMLSFGDQAADKSVFLCFRCLPCEQLFDTMQSRCEAVKLSPSGHHCLTLSLSAPSLGFCYNLTPLFVTDVGLCNLSTQSSVIPLE